MAVSTCTEINILSCQIQEEKEWVEVEEEAAEA